MFQDNHNTKPDKWEEIQKWLVTLEEIIVIAGVIFAAIIILRGVGIAEGADEELTAMYVLCEPDSEVIIRTFPRRGGGYEGFLMLGDEVWTDGKTRNGYIHVIDVAEGDGWVCKAYLMPDRPTVEEGPAWIWRGGKVAARKAPGGERIRWMREGDEVVLYAWCDEWAITDQGYIMTKYLEG